MIKGEKILAIIPARGGSKGIPRKNIREVGGKPLIAWTIDAARESSYIDRLILSSEDEEIIEIAREWGCDVPFTRPQELATDESGTAEVILHAITNIDERYDYIVVLQPTSPLRISTDIDNCIQYCHETNAPSCVSVTEAEKSPFWMYFLDDEGRMTSVIDVANRPTRRQEIPTAYALNGAVYVVEVESFERTPQLIDKQTVAYIMPKIRSLDIDTDFDLMLFQTLLDKTETNVHQLKSKMGNS